MKSSFDQHNRDFVGTIERLAKEIDAQSFREFCDLLIGLKKSGGSVYLLGNGGSSSVCSHAATDLCKIAGVRARGVGDINHLTCVGNDYGYENSFSTGLEWFAESSDLVVLVSSSGMSPNILRAAEIAKTIGCQLITFSGFSSENKLRTLGNLNFWVDSSSYNVVEMVHHIWLVSVCDYLGATAI